MRDEYVIYVSTAGMISFCFTVALGMYDIKEFKYFTRFDNKKEKGERYVEVTPFNKGNLYKFRMYYNGYNREPYYKVFYGTIEIASCTTLIDVIKFINQKMKREK